MEIRDLIRAARKAKGWSQRRLADEMNLNRSAVAQWELGDTNPTQENMAALKAVLPISDILSPSGSAPYNGQLVEDPDEIALLGFWRSLTPEKKRAVVELLHIGAPGKSV